VQFESLPFHSAKLPHKKAIPELIESTPTLRDYSMALAEALKGFLVIALSAVDTSHSIDVAAIHRSPWLKWQVEKILGIADTNRLKQIDLTTKKNTGYVTSAFLYERVGEHIRGIVLMMGGNAFPGDDGFEKLAEVLAERT
jgi:hypothetical protein